MARDLKKVQLGLFLTSNTPKMPKGGGRQIPLCSLYPCWTGPLLGSDLLCTVLLEPCKSHLIPAEAWECIGSLCSADLQALQCIILQACWLVCLLLFHIAYCTSFTAFLSLYSASYHTSLIPKRRTSSTFCPTQRAASTHEPEVSLSITQEPSALGTYTVMHNMSHANKHIKHHYLSHHRKARK